MEIILETMGKLDVHHPCRSVSAGESTQGLSFPRLAVAIASLHVFCGYTQKITEAISRSTSRLYVLSQVHLIL